eukprot:1869289-Rhodomonas_salina.2
MTLLQEQNEHFCCTGVNPSLVATVRTPWVQGFVQIRATFHRHFGKYAEIMLRPLISGLSLP